MKVYFEDNFYDFTDKEIIQGYEDGHLTLPDGRVVIPKGWLDAVWPPQPFGLKIKDSNAGGLMKTNE